MSCKGCKHNRRMDTIPEDRAYVSRYPARARNWRCYHPLNDVNTDFECDGADDPDGGFEPVAAMERKS